MIDAQITSLFFFSVCLSLFLSVSFVFFFLSSTPPPPPFSDRVCQQPGLSLWVPFQNAATAVTNLYKGKDNLAALPPKGKGSLRQALSPWLRACWAPSFLLPSPAAECPEYLVGRDLGGGRWRDLRFSPGAFDPVFTLEAFVNVLPRGGC